MAATARHKLTYFGFTPGRALPIRLAFFLGAAQCRCLQRDIAFLCMTTTNALLMMFELAG